MRKRQTFEPRPTDTHHMVIVHRLNPVKKRFGVFLAYYCGHRGPQQAEVERIMFAAIYFRRLVSDDLCSSFFKLLNKAFQSVEVTVIQRAFCIIKLHANAKLAESGARIIRQVGFECRSFNSS